MDYKIWIASYFVSPPPYLIEVAKEKIESQACYWKTEETIWRHIGTVDSLKAARYLVENDRGSYKDSEDNVYYLECEPSDELFCSFAKIEYGDTVEYYDWYVLGKETWYGRKNYKGSLRSNTHFSIYPVVSFCFNLLQCG